MNLTTANTTTVPYTFEFMVSDDPITAIVHKELWNNHLAYLFEMVNGSDSIHNLKFELRALVEDEILQREYGNFMAKEFTQHYLPDVAWHNLASLYWYRLRADQLSEMMLTLQDRVCAHGTTSAVHSHLWNQHFEDVVAMVAEAATKEELSRKLANFLSDAIEGVNDFYRHMILGSLVTAKWFILAEFYWHWLRNPVAH